MTGTSVFRKVVRLALVAALLVPSVGAVTSTSAFAAGTSAKTNGCYVQWWSTAWAAKCENTTSSGKYRAHVARADQSDYTGPWRSITKGATTMFDSGEAWRGVQNSGNWVEYRG